MIRIQIEQLKLAALFNLIALLFCGPIFGSVPVQFQQLFQADKNANESADVTKSVASYIYVDANEDGAGGGHVGLRIGDVVFHFQRSLDGFFMLDRSPWDGFQYSYSRIENRNITETYLKISDDQKQQLMNRLTAKSMRHRLLIKKYRELQEKIVRLTKLSTTGRVDVHYPVLRYYNFETEKLSYSTNNRILPGDIEDIELTLESYLQYGLEYGFMFHNNQFLETSLELPNAQTLKAVEDRIKFQLKQVLQTKYENRPDRARTYLELRVLLEAIQRSKERNQLVVPQMVVLVSNRNSESKIIEISQIQKQNDNSQKQNDTQLATFVNMYNQRLADLGNKQSDLIYLINRFFQSAALLATSKLNNSQQLILQGLLLDTPSLSVTINREYSDSNAIIIELKELQHQLSVFKKDIDKELSYSLLNRNCVTLLLNEVNTVVKLDLPLNRPISSLLFVPVVSSGSMFESIGTGDQFYYRSFRNDYLNWLTDQRSANSWVEISTISSNIYSFNNRDSVFLFFTENKSVVRPVLGIANLMASSAQIMVGLLYSPVDCGRNFSNGIRGFSFSMAEIGWLSIRKGTFRSDNPLFYSFPTTQKIK
ncbi:MAG: hypothetical protein H3C43_05830 [Leptonema sp. (in: Bacteria)]|nr:hypothetical protein [Leptonema sp. (in: bacteria)]